MGIIEQINNMKAQGISEEQIIKNLQEQGISPKEINDAISQIQIKNAVSSEGTGDSPPQPQAQEVPQGYYQEQGGYSPELTQGMQQEYYQETPEYSSAGGTETIIEIAEQVFIEKMQKTQKQIDSLAEFKSLTEVKIENLDKRLSRIENIIDKLQISILDKIGSYGKGLENTKKEMEMMQDSFRKVVGKKRKRKK